jgi:predicted TIM-barrel enzyme
MADADEKLDDRAAPMGIALVSASKSRLNYRVEVVIDLVSSHAASLLSWALTAIATNMMAHHHGDGCAINEGP